MEEWSLKGLNSSDDGYRIVRLWGSIPCLLMHWVPSALAGMALAVLYRQQISLIQSGFYLLGSSQIPETVQNMNVYL